MAPLPPAQPIGVGRPRHRRRIDLHADRRARRDGDAGRSDAADGLIRKTAVRGGAGGTVRDMDDGTRVAKRARPVEVVTGLLAVVLLLIVLPQTSAEYWTPRAVLALLVI